MEHDLVFEMEWETHTEFETLESAGLENPMELDTVPGAQRAYYIDEGDY